MSDRRRLQFTILLVAMGFVCSLLSLVTKKKGWGELYPFATWKLYVAPKGGTGIVSEYRIYSQQTQSSDFRRAEVRTTPAFYSVDDYLTTFNFLIKQTLSNPRDTAALCNLKLFVEQMEPGAYMYKIMQETYLPLEIYKNNSLFDTTTVFTFKGQLHP